MGCLLYPTSYRCLLGGDARHRMRRSVRSNVAINLQYLDRLEPWLCTPFALFGFSLVQFAQAGINRGTSL